MTGLQNINKENNFNKRYLISPKIQYKLYIFNYVYTCVSVPSYMKVRAGTLGDLMKALDSLEQGLKVVVNCSMWVLDLNSARAISTLNPGAISPAPKL